MSLADGAYTTRRRPEPSGCLPGCLWEAGHGGYLCALSNDEPVRTTKASRIAFLERKREATKADLLMKFEDQDWHGVQDCASDLRDIESELAGLRF